MVAEGEAFIHPSEPTWNAFIEGPVYADADAPWSADPAFAIIAEHAGLRDSISGRAAPALTLARELVQATVGVDLLEIGSGASMTQGLCLGFGMNVLEPYDLLQTFALNRVHAYEWIGEQVVETAQTLQTLRAEETMLPTRIRLYHGTISDLSALDNTSIHVIYAANVFNWEIPMVPETFERTMQEILRVLAPGGVVLSRGSAGWLEEHLGPHGRMLLPNPLVTVFQKRVELC